MSRVSFEVAPNTPRLRFLASLSDGTTVIEDSRQGELHAWFRLQDYLREHDGLKITALRVQNGDMEFCLPSGQEGYAFAKRVIYVFQAGQVNAVGVGYLDGETVKMTWLHPDTLGVIELQDRSIEQAGFSLIRNPK